MRYESIPRKIGNWTRSTFSYLKDEFGNWVYLLLVGFIILIYKPVLNLFDMVSGIILYIFLAIAAFAGLYYFLRKLLK